MNGGSWLDNPQPQYWHPLTLMKSPTYGSVADANLVPPNHMIMMNKSHKSFLFITGPLYVENLLVRVKCTKRY